MSERRQRAHYAPLAIVPGTAGMPCRLRGCP